MSQIHQKSFSMPASTINSYSRLSYTPWHAIAEFIDNSTQSYFDHKGVLDQQFDQDRDSLFVSVTYHRVHQTLSVRDNSIGMSLAELEVALDVAPNPPRNGSRSRYGMGLKTAACWFGELWTVKTKKLGDPREYTATFDVAKVAAGESIPIEEVDGFPEHLHYTELLIERVRMKLTGRTKGKIKEFLTSMYRYDILESGITIQWDQADLDALNFLDDLQSKDGGGSWYKEFSFEVGGKPVTGWVGVLQNGSRSKAGFSIMQNRRQIRGHPDSWRPGSLYGQLQGSNDLVNQRLVGVINLDGFEVSHTKDDIIWHGEEEDEIEKKLKAECWDFRQQANRSHRSIRDEREPNALDTEVAFDKIGEELNSSELVDLLELTEDLPSEEVVDETVEEFVKEKPGEKPSVTAQIGNQSRVRVFRDENASPQDFYYANDLDSDGNIIVRINWRHPFIKMLRGPESIANYLRECIYDALAQYKAESIRSRFHANTVLKVKDGLMRLPLLIEDNSNVADEALDSDEEE
ncbi:MAG: ATP-binding protein [Fimbriimonadaceae bacterium]|jgi:hypothetical protein|nr:ATP-binding protein [Fimbriimonadaceae bacterium]